MTRPHLFGAEGLTAIHRLMSEKPLLAFDFDGTLAPIVARPDDARMSRAVSARLSRLAERLPVAIITGRAVDDLRSRLGFVPTEVMGSHGAEDAAQLGSEPAWAFELDAMRAELAARAEWLGQSGVTMEDKGLSLALHYRLAPRPAVAIEAIRQILDSLPTGLRSFSGKMVENIVPQDAPDKADAMLRLVRRHGATAAFFAGDDVNDEPVFEAAPPSWLTVRVGRDSPASKARYFVDGPADMPRLLQAMLDCLERPLASR